MSLSPLAYADSLRIGTIDYVSSGEIKVLLDIEAPDGVALNTGVPRPFPRINGYVLIPCDEGFLTAQVEWITIERSQYPKRKGIQDFGLIDLPYPLRKIGLNPLGLLVYNKKDESGEDTYCFRRGVKGYPTVGDPVLLPTQKQLKAIIESGENRHVLIGTSPMAANAEVKIDPDRLFGRHLAVLGNTGSGKSCSVAGLIRWSIEEARNKRCDGEPNARFIIIDPNGEYSNTFKTLTGVRCFAIEPNDKVEQLKIPMWLWNSAEWCAFTQASSKTQRPTLIQALRTLRDGTYDTAITPSHDMRRYLRTLVNILKIEKNNGNPWGNFPKPKNLFEKLKIWQNDLIIQDIFSSEEKKAITAVHNLLKTLIDKRSVQYTTYNFSKKEIDELQLLLQKAHNVFGGSDLDILPIDADVPRPFTGAQLLQSVEATSELLGVTEHVETMQMRIKTLISDIRMKAVSGEHTEISLEDWLCNYIGNGKNSDTLITVIDLSLAPAEVIHIITAVIARMTLESLQRYRRLNHGLVLPTVLVMEEAHTFIKRYNDDTDNQNSSSTCCRVFEKIAREGRKFGLGLVLSSQRPSELSPTVLSQCNSFLLHRISNDQDQELVKRLLPDNLRGMLRDLPSLPPRHAILLGWASELPVLVQMNELPESYRPKSDDPDFWAVWSGADYAGRSVTRDVDWKTIADDWQQPGGTSVS